MEEELAAREVDRGSREDLEYLQTSVYVFHDSHATHQMRTTIVPRNKKKENHKSTAR